MSLYLESPKEGLLSFPRYLIQSFVLVFCHLTVFSNVDLAIELLEFFQKYRYRAMNGLEIEDE